MKSTITIRKITGLPGCHCAACEATKNGGIAGVCEAIGTTGHFASYYEHVQSSASATWTVNHNFGRYPSSVHCITSGGLKFDAEVVHVSENQAQILLTAPITGRVICSG